MSARLLIALYLAVTLLPLVLAWAGARPPRGFRDELASGAGMLAFAIVLVEFLLSGRFRILSARVGMDVTMRFHQLMARTALVLAIVHPFLYRAPFAPARPWDVSRQLTLSVDFGSLVTGMLAWVLLCVLIVLAIARDKLAYRYETWRLMHGLGALVIAALLLDHTLGAGRYSLDPVLAGVWIVLFALAVSSLGYVYLVKPVIQRRRPWTVESVRRIALRTWQLTILPRHPHRFDYEAGQFVWLNVGRSPFLLNENPFSISSAPASGPRLEFVIKELGDFTRTLGSIAAGTTAYVDGPHGHLVVSGRSEPGIVLIAGGVGIAPLIGILRQLSLTADPRPTTLIYANRDEAQIVFREELEALAREPGTELVQVLSEPPPGWTGRTGLVDRELLQSVVGAQELSRRLFLLCGPAPMMEAVENALIALGVPAHRILSERFSYD